MIVELLKVKDLAFDPANARKHGTKNLEAIKGSLTKFKQQKPIVIDGNGIVIAGNGTLAAAKSLGWENIAAVRTELTGPDAIAFALADNRTAELAEWDMDNLGPLLKSLDDMDFDLGAIGFDAKDMSKLVPVVETAGECDEDEVPAEVETRCKLGDVWQLGRHRLVCGDATDPLQVSKLMNGATAEVLFTDPPYGYSYESNFQTKHSMLENDDKLVDFMPVVSEFMAENSCAFVCGSHQTIELWKPLFTTVFSYKNLIVWKKNNWSMGDLKGAFAGQHELILFGHKGKVELLGARDTDVWEFDRDPPSEHPTQKPVELISYAISKVPGENVLDLFVGSGSTIVACEKINRTCFAMEISPKYCDVALSRWEKFTGIQAKVVSL